MRLILLLYLLLSITKKAQADNSVKEATAHLLKPKREYRLLDSITPVLQLDKFYMNVMKFGCNREFQIPEIECKDWIGRVSAEWDMTLFKHGFWRNELHGEGAHGKFYTIGWNYEIGVKLGRQLEFYWEHHSRHTMDIEQPYYVDRRDLTTYQYRYPVEDSIGFRFKIYERK
jgi:hypothetical protein